MSEISLEQQQEYDEDVRYLKYTSKIFRENIMQKTEIDTLVYIGRRPLQNPRFADDIDLLRGSNEELQQPTETLEKTAPGYKMEIAWTKAKSSNPRQQHPSE